MQDKLERARLAQEKVDAEVRDKRKEIQQQHLKQQQQQQQHEPASVEASGGGGEGEGGVGDPKTANAEGAQGLGLCPVGASELDDSNTGTDAQSSPPSLVRQQETGTAARREGRHGPQPASETAASGPPAGHPDLDEDDESFASAVHAREAQVDEDETGHANEEDVVEADTADGAQAQSASCADQTGEGKGVADSEPQKLLLPTTSPSMQLGTGGLPCWVRALDDESGDYYWYNLATNATTWDEPSAGMGGWMDEADVDLNTNGDEGLTESHVTNKVVENEDSATTAAVEEAQEAPSKAAETAAKAEAEAKAKAEANAEADAKANTEVAAAARVKIETEAKATVEISAKAKAEAAVEAAVKMKAGAATKVEATTEAEVETAAQDTEIAAATTAEKNATEA
jgi:hypothetical protein